jgi:hypothetical protein
MAVTIPPPDEKINYFFGKISPKARRKREETHTEARGKREEKTSHGGTKAQREEGEVWRSSSS